MSHITIKDLVNAEALDPEALARIRGGTEPQHGGYLPENELDPLRLEPDHGYLKIPGMGIPGELA